MHHLRTQWRKAESLKKLKVSLEIEAMKFGKPSNAGEQDWRKMR
jgi:hypothetical protein